MNARAIAVLSDIHGNRDALDAVFRDIDRRGITNIVNLGDSFYGPLDPAGTAALLMERDIPTVSGNEDRIIYDPLADSEYNPTLAFTREALHSEHIQWLKSLPKTQIVFDNCLLCHGTPARDTEYLLYEVSRGGLVVRASEDVKELLPELRSDQIVLCGHSHLFRVVQHAGCPLVINAGSVGLQAFTDDKPAPHHVSTGSPHARYAIVTIREHGNAIEEVVLSYEWERAAAQAEQHGRADWAKWLRTGKC